MNEHTFPMPDLEMRKLDHLRAELSATKGAVSSLRRWVGENPLTATIAGGLLGLVLVRCLKSRSSLKGDPAT
jgi:hypothetical protein